MVDIYINSPTPSLQLTGEVREEQRLRQLFNELHGSGFRRLGGWWVWGWFSPELSTVKFQPGPLAH